VTSEEPSADTYNAEGPIPIIPRGGSANGRDDPLRSNTQIRLKAQLSLPNSRDILWSHTLVPGDVRPREISTNKVSVLHIARVLLEPTRL
jgi:hypothetical protein